MLSCLLIEIMLFPILLWMVKFSHFFEEYELFYSVVNITGLITQTIIDSFWALYLAIPVMVHLRVGEFAQPSHLGLSGFKTLLAKFGRHLTRTSSRARRYMPPRS